MSAAYPPFFLLYAVLLVGICMLCAYFSFRVFRYNRQLVAGISTILGAHQKDVEDLAEVWARLNADHREVMDFVRKPQAPVETPLPMPVEFPPER